MLISNLSKKLQKILYEKKVINKNVTERRKYFFNGVKISMKFCVL
jgi:hypothetical protein